MEDHPEPSAILPAIFLLEHDAPVMCRLSRMFHRLPFYGYLTVAGWERGQLPSGLSGLTL
jgi:hypothetical protein